MNGLEFRYPFNVIYIIILIACLAVFILGYYKKKKILILLKFDAKVRFISVKIILMTIAIGLIVFSLLGPQKLKGLTEVNRKGLDIYVLIDTSKSMLAEDIKPNRISRARKIVENIIDNLEGDRIGFIPFSSSAFVQMPLTDDYDLAKMFLKVIDTDMIGGGGSNVGTAISLADKSFDQTSSADKVVIVLSDGEEHDSNSLEVLKKINDDNLKVFTIGIGTDKGGLIPVYDPITNDVIDYKKDQNGQPVMSKLNSDILKRLASSGDGAYYQSSLTGEEINSLINDIRYLKRDVLKTRKLKRYRLLYQYFLGAGILLFVLAYLIPERRKLQ
ncbi:VWA domain-containing protein [Vallitalea sp.]|uniref:VWA domain-containing protein n=1 Tax=Vallitalea sp. TaxID=1882829 RepID=UPI0025D9758C|nr:VWA domain-containing protein [Vallitalea sp.]MCT4688182.1 VWA domain-containing protein [Vallitalea sp.]